MTNKENIISWLKNKRFVRTSLLFWLILYLLLVAAQYSGGREGDYSTLIRITIANPDVMLVFYFNFFLCEIFFLKKKRTFFLYHIAALIFLLFAAYFFNKNQITTLQNKLHISWNAAVVSKLFAIPIYYVIIILISILYWSVSYASKKAKENLEIALRLQNMEHEKVIAEKQFLQSQINPHFLYNTLNFFYAKSLSLSPELAESVLLLSNIMRYSLEQKENSSGMIFLEDEIEHINNVIKINQFRFNNKLQTQFLVSGNTKNVRIVPLVLITLVENAFKHGELLNADFPVTIILAINENNQTLNFIVKNKKKTGPKETGTGIGLENAKRRLAFVYNGNETLELKDQEELYTAILKLPLFKDA